MVAMVSQMMFSVMTSIVVIVIYLYEHKEWLYTFISSEKYFKRHLLMKRKLETVINRIKFAEMQLCKTDTKESVCYEQEISL